MLPPTSYWNYSPVTEALQRGYDTRTFTAQQPPVKHRIISRLVRLLKCFLTWDDDDLDATITGTNYKSNNLYRKFKVTGHVTNQFNTEFAKLDSFPTAEAKSQPVESTELFQANLPDLQPQDYQQQWYRSIVRTLLRLLLSTRYRSLLWVLVQRQKRLLSSSRTKERNVRYGYESSSEKQIAEEINGFSALSRPVEVDKDSTGANNARWTITFDAADGDVAQLVAHASVGTASVVTRANGWSLKDQSAQTLTPCKQVVSSILQQRNNVSLRLQVLWVAMSDIISVTMASVGLL